MSDVRYVLYFYCHCDMLSRIIHIKRHIGFILGCSFFNNISRYCCRKLQKDSTPWYCKNCLKQVLSFNKLIDYHLKALKLGKVLTSPKLLSTKNYLLFSRWTMENVAKTELMTPDNFYQINIENLNILFLHMNIF